MAQEVYAREKERTRTERPTPKKKERKKENKEREPVLEKIITCNSVPEPSEVAIPGRCGGAALARHGARGMRGGGGGDSVSAFSFLCTL